MSLHRGELFELEGRTAVVTGAGGFLGRTMCDVLLQNGASVIAVGRSAGIEERYAEWRAVHGDRVEAMQVDLDDDDARHALCDILGRRTIDVLVNNAFPMGSACGFNSPSGRLENLSANALSASLAGGIRWPLALMQAVGNGMRDRRAGSIINIASMYGVVSPSPHLYAETDFLNPAGYSIAKAGMLALTRYAASFWGADGVRVNSILPGPFSNTETITENSVPAESDFLRRLADRTALGRTGAPSELAGALLFLASDASSYVTGHALVVDGGWTIT